MFSLTMTNLRSGLLPSSPVRPTICSTNRDKVINPAMPPNSSTTSEILCPDSCISSNRSSSRFVSGTKFACLSKLITEKSGSSDPSDSDANTSLTEKIPTTSSWSVSKTGNLVCGETWYIFMKFRYVTSTRIQMISGRGVITSRTSISPKRKMFSSISPVFSSTVPSASPRSISVRSSPEVTIGLERESLPPRSRMMPRGTRVNANTTGHVIVIKMRTIRAVMSDHFSGARIASVFGVSSPTITIAIVAIPVATTVESSVACPLSPMVEIAKVVPTVATMMLNRFPTSKIVPKNFSYCW